MSSMIFLSKQTRLHKVPAGYKMVSLMGMLLILAMLPAQFWTILAHLGCLVAVYGFGQIGFGVLAKIVWGLRWIALFIFVPQVIFADIDIATVTTVRIMSAIALASVLTLTISTLDMLATIEKGFGWLRIVRASPERFSLMLVITLTTIPFLAQLVAERSLAYRARGVSILNVWGIVSFFVSALVYSDERSEALIARGVDERFSDETFA